MLATGILLENDWGILKNNSKLFCCFSFQFCFVQVTSLDQRFAQLEFQPESVDNIYPTHKHLMIKRSQRCRRLVCLPGFYQSQTTIFCEYSSNSYDSLSLSFSLSLTIKEKITQIHATTNTQQNAIQDLNRHRNISDNKYSELEHRMAEYMF